MAEKPNKVILIKCFIAWNRGDRKREFESCAKGKDWEKEQKREEEEDDDLYYIHRLTLEAPGSLTLNSKTKKGQPPTERALTVKLMSTNYFTLSPGVPMLGYLMKIVETLTCTCLLIFITS